MQVSYTWRKLFTLSLLLLFTISIHPSASLAEEYNFVSIKGLIEQEVGREILPKVYEKLGVTVTISPEPGKRAQMLATSGKKDGEIMRIFTYGENNPTVVRVPTPYYSLETMGFIKKGSGVVINSKEDLMKYKVVKVLGVKHTDNISKGMPADQVNDVSSTESAMKTVLKGRADVALTNTTDGLMVIKNAGLTDMVPLEKPLAVLELYNYIHESKADIVPKVDETLKSMKASGELDKVIKEAEQKVIENFGK